MNIFFVSLGCDKNLVDSETMLGILHDNNYKITYDEQTADIIIINTCCFINDAKEESINTILEMAQYKKTGRLQALIVAGCLAQRYREEILKEIPEVDALIGTSNIENIVNVINDILESSSSNYKDTQNNNASSQTTQLNAINNIPAAASRRLLTSGTHYAHLKIAEGCDKHCTYCVIPQIRGNYRSVPMDKLIDEAEYLAKLGVKELILVAQETTLYGVDIYGNKALPELLHRLCRINDLEWIRIMYCYPEEITDELIQVIKTEKKIRKYLDLPIQHASDRILKLMGRRTSKSDLINIIKALRDNITDIVLRTTLITGFPTETEEEHQELMRFIEEMQFERLGVFTYSKEDDTPAAKLKPQVPMKDKKRRQKELMQLQQEIVFRRNEGLIGNIYEVLIEGKVADEENIYIGRTYMDAPQIDGFIFLASDNELISGDIVTAQVTEAKAYDLIGKLVKGE